jgi:hypothetical protein
MGFGQQIRYWKGLNHTVDPIPSQQLHLSKLVSGVTVYVVPAIGDLSLTQLYGECDHIGHRTGFTKGC